MKKILSFIKSCTLCVIFFLLYPILLVLPKYQAYIFVLTTGRSGSGTLANILKNACEVNAFHEPYPILNNSFGFAEKKQKLWVMFQFYFLKLPLIYLSRLSGIPYYLETNHLFLKSFSGHAIHVFGKKMKVIHLKRPVEQVAKSMFEINKIPGNVDGNVWYLDPKLDGNLIDFGSVFEGLKDPEKIKFADLYKCIWYWFEMEARIKAFKDKSNSPILELQTTDLDDGNALVSRMNECFKLRIKPLGNRSLQVDRNLKKDEKKNPIELELVEEKSRLFIEACGITND